MLIILERTWLEPEESFGNPSYSSFLLHLTCRNCLVVNYIVFCVYQLLLTVFTIHTSVYERNDKPNDVTDGPPCLG